MIGYGNFRAPLANPEDAIHDHWHTVTIPDLDDHWADQRAEERTWDGEEE